MESQYNERLRDWQNLFAIWRFVILTFHCSNGSEVKINKV